MPNYHRHHDHSFEAYGALLADAQRGRLESSNTIYLYPWVDSLLAGTRRAEWTYLTRLLRRLSERPYGWPQNDWDRMLRRLAREKGYYIVEIDPETGERDPKLSD